MSRAFFKVVRLLSLRPMRDAGWRTVLAAVAAVLGVALFAATRVAYDSALLAVDRTFDAVAGRSTLVVRGDSPLAESVLREVLNVPGVRFANPRIRVRTDLHVAGQQPHQLWVLGVQVVRESMSRNRRALQVRYLGDGKEALADRQAVFLTHDFATKHGLRLGSEVQLQTPRGPQSLTVRALFEPVGLAKALGDGLALCGYRSAQELFGRSGRLDEIDVFVEPTARPEDVRDRLTTLIGDGATVAFAPGHDGGLRRSLDAYRLTMSMISALALLTGMLIVMSALDFQVGGRQVELLVLSRIGASRRTVFALVALQAVLLGVLAAALGYPLGYLLAGWTVEAVEQSLLLQLGEAVEIHELAAEPRQIALVVAVAIGSMLLAAVLPARRAAHGQVTELSTRLQVGFGFGCLAWTVVAAVLRLSSEVPALRVVNAVTGVAAAALLAAPLLRGLSAWQMRVGGWRGVVRGLTLRRLQRRPGRSATAVRLVAVGLSLLVVVTAAHHSLRRVVEEHLDTSLQADLVVVVSRSKSLPPDALRLPEVQSVVVATESEISHGRLLRDPHAILHHVRLHRPQQALVLRSQLETQLADYQATVLLGAVFREQLTAVVDQGFAFAEVIEALVLLLCGLGILISGLLNNMERLPELGILRNLGMSRAQATWLVLSESLRIGVSGALLALAAGLVVAFFWVTWTLPEVFGFDTTFHVPWPMVWGVPLLGGCLGLLAGFQPALHARRV